MKLPRCIITGCALVDPFSERWDDGDLHIVGDALVFNATLDEACQTRWNWQKLPSMQQGRFIALQHPDAAFERRGVIVMDRLSVSFSPDAMNYLLGAKQ